MTTNDFGTRDYSRYRLYEYTQSAAPGPGGTIKQLISGHYSLVGIINRLLDNQKRAPQSLFQIEDTEEPK
jgi:hypothetical protein